GARRRDFVLLPELPICGKKVGGFVGAIPARDRRALFWSNVTADNAAPAVGSNLDRTSFPVLLLNSRFVADRDVLWAPEHVIVVEEGAELRDFERLYLVRESCRVDVLA